MHFEIYILIISHNSKKSKLCKKMHIYVDLVIYLLYKNWRDNEEKQNCIICYIYYIINNID